MKDTFIRRLSTTVGVVCLLALAGTVGLVVNPALREWAGFGPTAEPAPYAVGDRVDIDAASYATAPLSLIVFARSTCAACQRSADFHKQVVSAGNVRGVPAVLVTPSAELDVERAYAERLGIAATDVYEAPPGSIKLRAVPALMVVDTSGLIRHVWFGAPDSAAQVSILAAVMALVDARVP